MEFILVSILSPMAIVMGFGIYLWRNRKISKSTAEIFRSIARDEHGQDLIEYALIAFFIALAGAAIMPELSTAINHILSKFPAVAGDTLAGRSQAREISGDAGMWIRMTCGAVAVITLIAIVLRRRDKPRD